MKHNKKTILLILITITTLILLSTASATTDTNTTTTSSIKEKTTTTEPVVKEKIENTQTKEKVDKTQDKQITKKNKTKEKKKTDSITIDGIEYVNIYENQEIPDYTEIDEGNTLFNNCNFTNLETVALYDGILALNNSNVNDSYIWADTIILLENNIISLNSYLDCNQLLGELTYSNYTFNTFKQINGIVKLDNIIINTLLYLGGNTTIINSIINSTINGNMLGNLTIGENVSFTENAFVENFNNISSVNIESALPYIERYNGNYTLEDFTFKNSRTNSGNLTLKNCVVNNFENRGNLTIINCTLNGTINNRNDKYFKGVLNINNDTITTTNFSYTGTGEVIGDKTIIGLYDGNIMIENKTLNSKILIPTTGNITLTNCQINAKITNNGNLTLVNCSLSNNNMTTTGSKTDGFLLENNGNLEMNDCIVENNTFNTTNENVILYGLIYNNGSMNVFKSNFINNKIGFIKNGNDGYSIGSGVCITNNGILKIKNSTFNNNLASNSGAIYSGIRYYNSEHYQYEYSQNYLNIENSQFNNNFAGTNGSAITGRNSEFKISNCNFTNNSIDNKIGGYYYPGGITSSGGAINIEGRGIITECEFKNNNVGSKPGLVQLNSFRGGAISIKGFNNITNCKFINNTAEQGAAIVNEIYDYNIRPDSVLEYTRIENCTFEENYAEFTSRTKDTIIINYGLLNLNNNTFTNNYHANNLIVSIDESEYLPISTMDTIITNNNFINNSMTSNTIHLKDGSNRTINNNQYTNTTINDIITLELPNYIFTEEPLTITGTYTINNLTYYDNDIVDQNKFNIYINGELVQTVDTLEFTITPHAGKMILTVQPSISQTRKTINLNPLNNVTITPENYNEYIYNGNLIGISQKSKITFQGEFTDKGEIFIDTEDIILDGSNATFTNTIFTLEASGITLQNMKINNTQTEYPIQNTKDNNNITGNTIILNNTYGKTAAIYNTASNTIISHNTILVDGPATTIEYIGGLGIANTQAILLLSGDKNIIEYNNIHVTSSSTSGVYGTIEAITNHDHATNTQIRYNNITTDGNGRFNYAINTLANVEDINITNNNISVTGERYTAGIQAGNGAKNIIINNNNIKCICLNTTPVDEEAITYGIVTTNMGSGISNNINITNNNIDLTGSVNYGIEVYQTTNTVVDKNVIYVKGLQSMGIGYAHSPESVITYNIITTDGDSTIPLTHVTEEIKQANVGIQIQQDSNNILIMSNTIQTYDKGTQDTCINIDSNNITVNVNYLTSTIKTGNEAVLGRQDTDIMFNYAVIQESSTNIEDKIIIGKNTTITAQFYDADFTPVTTGVAIFKVNGKTLRDNNGNVIYADVINGRAELPNVNITQEWTKEDTTIQAMYIGNDNNEPITTTPTTVTVTKPEATITLEAPTEATAGTTITLKATVTDGENNITSGRVAFKLNGKTLKNADGKALYAEVIDGIATIQYTIPTKTKAKEYVLTAIFTDTAYDRVEAESKLNVVKA